MLLINFKNYPQVMGPKALSLAQALSQAAQAYPVVKVGFAPPPLELAEVAAHTKALIWSQHTDPAQGDKTTGFASPKEAQAAGAVGTFLNHSEHHLNWKTLSQTVEVAREAGLKILIFAKGPREVEEARQLQPDFLGYEPPELIGGNVSVSSAKSHVIKEAVAAAKEIPLLVGAGIHEKKDIEVALSLGAVGAVVSSAVVTAPNPAKVFRDLLSGFKS
ncbi:MAG: triose-phosphate isomerase [Patescibacteria group bacterium]